MADGLWAGPGIRPDTVDVGPADRRQTDLNHGFARPGFRKGIFVKAKLLRRSKYIGLHEAARGLSGLAFFQL